jgi:hypothetical protein
MGWLIIVGLFVAGVALYSYGVYQDRQRQQRLSTAFNNRVDSLLGQVHTVTDSLKARMTTPSSDFERQLREAMKDNP